MKTSTIFIITIILIGLIGCNSTKTNNIKSEPTENTRVPLKTVDEAFSFIAEHFKNPEETLWIAESLNDNGGINMAIILDKILKAGYMPDGFEQKEGYRLYKYKK